MSILIKQNYIYLIKKDIIYIKRYNINVDMLN